MMYSVHCYIQGDKDVKQEEGEDKKDESQFVMTLMVTITMERQYRVEVVHGCG